MIAPIGFRPQIKVGRHYVSCYDEDWLRTVLDRAALRLNVDITPYREDILAGIMYYIEEICPLSGISLEDLFHRIKLMLTQVGLSHLAEMIKVTPPPFTLNLCSLFSTHEKLSLHDFFFLVEDELRSLREAGVESCTYTGVHESIRRLIPGRHCGSVKAKREKAELDLLSIIHRTWSTQKEIVA